MLYLKCTIESIAGILIAKPYWSFYFDKTRRLDRLAGFFGKTAIPVLILTVLVSITEDSEDLEVLT